jgi:hypothetical protein
MTLERAEAIARDPTGATPRQRRDAYFYARKHVENPDDGAPWLRQQHETVTRRLETFRRETGL